MSTLSEKNRKRLLQAAGKLFATSGFAAVSTRDLCEKAGVNVAAISYYFSGKEGLYLEVFKESARTLVIELDKTLEKHNGQIKSKKKMESAIRDILLSFVRLRIQKPEIAVLLQREAIINIPGLKAEYEAIVKPLSERLLLFFSNLQDADLIRRDLNLQSFLIVAIESIWGYFAMLDRSDGLVATGYRLPQDQEKFADFLADMYVRGICV